MITHVVVELEHPIEEGWMRDYSDEYYGIGRPLTMCKDCMWWHEHGQYGCSHDFGADDYCSKAERKEE